MAAPAPAFTKGDVVFMWNQDTKACDKEGVVNDVLEQPMQMGDGELPVGSVGVSSRDGLQTLWVRPEHAGAVLKRKDPPARPARLAKSEDAQDSSPAVPKAKAPPRPLQVGDKVVATEDFDASSKILSSWISASLGAYKVTKGGHGVVEEIAESGEVTVTFEGSWHRRVVPKDKVRFLEVQVANGKSPPTGATPSASSTSQPGGFSVGDPVHIWSGDEGAWLEDGAVLEVAKESRSGGDVDIPVGSILVSFRSGRGNRWIAPKQMRKEVRHAKDGGKRTPPSGMSTLGSGPRYSVGDFRVGDKVHLFHLSRKEWIQDAVISTVLEEAQQADTVELPVGTLVVACENGTESHTVMPALFDSMLRREEHFGWNEVDPTKQAAIAPRPEDVVDDEVPDEGVHQPPPSSSPTGMVPSGNSDRFNPPGRPLTADGSPTSARGASISITSIGSPVGGRKSSGFGDMSGKDGSPKALPSPKADMPLLDAQSFAPIASPTAAGASDAKAPATPKASASPKASATPKASGTPRAVVLPRAPATPTAGAAAAAAQTLPRQSSSSTPDGSPTGAGAPPASLFTTPTAAPPSPAAAADAAAAAEADGDADGAAGDAQKRPPSPPPIVVRPPLAPSAFTLTPPAATLPAGGVSSPNLATGTLPASGTSSPRPAPEAPPTGPYDRTQKRVLIIGTGFGMELNPAQFQVVRDAGFQIRVVTTLPNPENPQFPVHTFLPTITKAIKEFDPHLVVSASKGGAYISQLWLTGQWKGPSVVINRHPALMALPKGQTVVLCHGSNDEYYQYKREDIEHLVRSGSPNRVLLYYTGNSGLLGRGYTREGDRHNMASLLVYDCLPRLFDAAMCGGNPEISLMLSWNRFVTQERLTAEAWLGYNPRDLRKLWQSEEQKGMDENVLFAVDPSSEEYRMVEVCFRAQPTVPRAYHDMNPGMWTHLTIHKIERVENGMQEDGNAEPYYRSLARGIENQGLEFRPGLHTKWAFHGSSAVDDIVNNPISGFQPLMSGHRAAALWGPGTYFARDAKYVYDGGFCKMLPDGGKVMLLCLLMTGIPCLGDPNHPGVLPVRHGRHRYSSSVDCLSNPEIYVTQNPGAAYPAYVITFS